MLAAERDKAEADAAATREDAGKEREEVEARLREQPAALAAEGEARQRSSEATADAEDAARRLAGLEKGLLQLLNKLKAAADDVERIADEARTAQDDEAAQKKLLAKAQLMLENIKKEERALRAEAGRLTPKEAIAIAEVATSRRRFI